MKQNSFKNNNNLLQLNAGKREISFLKIKSLVYLLLGISFFYLVFNTSCANPGMPTGGDKDSIPPVMLRTDPGLRSTNFKGTDLRFTFDEFIIPDEISEKLVISPPMKKKPLIKMKGKTLIIEFQDKLREESTYSLDFKDAVADFNEKNPIEDLRFSFSTGPVHDSLRVAGYVRDALSQEPVDKVLVMLHRIHDYTAFIDSIPDYIGTTNEEGLFMINNVSPGSYRLYGLTDSDNSLNYNQTAEKIAFADSLIVPSARFVSETDTIVENNDTIVVSGHTDFSPEPQYLMMFEEEKFDQYLDSYKRNQANKVDFIFTESLSDSFRINLISPVPDKEWLFIESNLRHDSITAWITDTLISKRDTLVFQLKYEVLDTLQQLTTKTDTLELLYETPKVTRQRKKKNDVAEVPTIALLHNISSTGHDIYRRINIEAPEPLASFETSMVRLYSVLDSVNTLIPIEVVNDSNSIRKYFIEHNWEPNSDYLLQIDSAAARNIYGHPSMEVNQKFKTQKEDYYGKIILTISNLREPALVQLLSNDETERVLQKIQILEDGTIEFPFLKPEKYRIRVIIDPNQNGQWDTGFLAEGLQPEPVVYFPKIIKVRSNFEYRESMLMDYDATHKKELIDEDLEKEEARKKEKARKKGEESD
ncbi:MAG TPA: Ig-like domain-containing protein [Prolixibacteraceae bacterium]|nr:Ig-like domain-containing protein [Prolixibacteraceae bacterium]